MDPKTPLPSIFEQLQQQPRGLPAAIADPVEGPSEEVSMAKEAGNMTVANGRFSPGDLVVLVSCALFAEPFCHAAAAEFLAAHYDKAALGFTIGVPPGLAGGTFHWWKRKIGKTAQRAAIPVALTLGIVGAILAFGYIAGPDIYRRAIARDTTAKGIEPAVNVPRKAAEIPTSLRVQFDADGKATNIDKANVQGYLLTTGEVQFPHAQIGPLLTPICENGTGPFITRPFTFGNTLSSSTQIDNGFCIQQTKTLVFFLVFDRPISFQKIKLDSHGTALPNWDKTLTTPTYAIITIHGELKNMVLDVEMAN